MNHGHGVLIGQGRPKSHRTIAPWMPGAKAKFQELVRFGRTPDACQEASLEVLDVLSDLDFRPLVALTTQGLMFLWLRGSQSGEIEVGPKGNLSATIFNLRIVETWGVERSEESIRGAVERIRVFLLGELNG